MPILTAKSKPDPTTAAPVIGRPHFPAWLLAVLLALVTIALYWPATRCDFVNYDDRAYVTENVHVQNGLTWESFKWAFYNTEQATYWAPIMWLSHMLACELFGLNPWGHHLINILLHAANAVLLFRLLRNLTGAQWRSALVAALFAVHPLRVESVAWVTERKDVLSLFFFLLTLLLYARFAREQKSGSNGPGAGEATIECTGQMPSSIFHLPSSSSYYLALVFFALGLMSKPMLVTLPFVLLLLDYWPLGRVAGGGWRVASDKNSGSQLPGAPKRSEGGSITPLFRLLFEKLPFFGLAAVASVVTFVVQKHGGAVAPVASLSWGGRSGNALVSYCRYLEKMFWPADLAPFYPHPGHWPVEQVLLAGLFLCGLSAYLFRKRGRYPFLLMGWLWYLGTLVPVIGLVQAGSVAMADRFTYIPLIGPVISLVWLVSEKWPARILPRVLLTSLTAAVLAGCIFQTRYQLQFWKDTGSLSRHTVAVNGEDSRNEYIRGLELERQGDIRQAMEHYRNATTIQPMVREAFWAMGRLFAQEGNWAEAEKTYSHLLLIERNDFTSHLGLAITLPHLGRMDEAVTQLQAAEQTCPDTPGTMNNLAWTLATSAEAGLRNGTQAVRYAERACELTDHRETVTIGTLAAAYAEAGRFDEAMAMAQKACALASAADEQDLLKKNQELLTLYRARQPYHEAAELPVRTAP